MYSESRKKYWKSLTFYMYYSGSTTQNFFENTLLRTAASVELTPIYYLFYVHESSTTNQNILFIQPQIHRESSWLQYGCAQNPPQFCV